MVRAADRLRRCARAAPADAAGLTRSGLFALHEQNVWFAAEWTVEFLRAAAIRGMLCQVLLAERVNPEDAAVGNGEAGRPVRRGKLSAY